MEKHSTMDKITLNFDGSCEPVNPGGNMGFGFVLKLGSSSLHTEHGFKPASPANSNNVAEYMALNAGLQWLINEGFVDDEIEVLGDSMLVINQMAKTWRAKGGMYFAEYQRAVKLRDQFANISFRWIRRDQNTEADQLSRSDAPLVQQ